MRLLAGYRLAALGRILVGHHLIGTFDPAGLFPDAVLMNAAHSHHPFPFAPAGLLSGAALMDASGA